MKSWNSFHRISMAVGFLWLLLLTFRNELRQLTGFPGEVNWLDGTVITPIPLSFETPGWWLLMLNLPVILLLMYVLIIAGRRRLPSSGDRVSLGLLVFLQVAGIIVLPQHGGADLVHAWLLDIPVAMLLAVAFWNGMPQRKQNEK